MSARLRKALTSFPPRTPRAADAVALVAGAVLPFGFAPFGFWPLAWLAPAVLFLLWIEGTPARAAWRGFLFGLGMFGVGVSWVYVSLHDFGHMPAPLAGFATLLLVAGLALYPALLGWLQARFSDAQGRANPLRGDEHRTAAERSEPQGSGEVEQRTEQLPRRAGVADRARARHLYLALPVMWTLFEWWRGWFLTGFPWLNLGYSQSDTWLAGYAPWVGVYGISLASALVAGLLAYAWRVPEKFLRRILPALLAILAGGLLAGRVEWTEPAGVPIEVALVQGNIPLAIKWQPAYREPILEQYRVLSARAPQARLVVWPEAAIPARLDEVDPQYLAALRQDSAARDVDYLIGVVEGDGRSVYNSVVVLGEPTNAYRKRHLVPFGEFLPWPAVFRWLVDSLRIPMSDFSRGPAGQPPLTAVGQRLGVSVCYEDAFGEELIRALPAATLLVNVSEDAWFGDSFAPHQRLQMARLRALEAGRPMLRAANTGPSAAIDHRGQVLTRTPQFQATTLTVAVEPRRGVTPYARTGNLPLLALLIGLSVIVAVSCRFARRTR